MVYKKKCVVHNLNFSAPYPGNLMRSIWSLEQRCKEENIELVYCFPERARCLTWVDEMIQQGKKVCFKPSKNCMSFWGKLINEYRPVAIHTHFWNVRDSLMLRLTRIFNPKLRLVLHHHNTYFESKKRWKELLKRAIIKSDIHIACGVALGDNLRKQGFKNVITAENAIDFSRLDTYTFLNRKDFDINDDALVFLIFGHEVHRKGVDIAVKAMRDLVRDKEAVLGVVIASDLNVAKQKLSLELGEIPTWVKFFPPRDDIATYYRFSDVFLSPSREEGCCYALPEAAYTGCKIIFSDIDGQMHAADIPGSLTFKSESVEDLQRQINIALNNEGTNVTNVAKEYVCGRYGLSKWSEAITNIYRGF